MPKILCVDDVPDNLKLLGSDLEDEGFEVVTASDGALALEELDRTDFSAVILDWMMPGLSGIETLKRIREQYSNVELPVIMATALSETDNIVEALGAGANDYVTKPIEVEVLMARLRAHLHVQELAAELRRAATTDFLTKLPNRRHFFELVRSHQAAMLRGTARLAVAMMDIDHFKSVNDQYGHDMGDEVLRAVAQKMRTELRETDVLGRLGGEEFAVMMHNVDAQTAADTLDRVRAAVAAETIALGGTSLRVTISIGFASEPRKSIEEMLTHADLALYEAKRGGRNRVVHESPEQAQSA